MTKEKLEKEAKEYADWFWGASPSMMKALAEAYIKGAEPREKQIQIDAEQIRALQKQNGELQDRVKELEEQIEKMKCCSNCQTVRDAEGNCYLKKDGKCKDKDKWELRR